MDQRAGVSIKAFGVGHRHHQGANLRYEYSDAIGFKTIIAFIMHDWQLLDECYQEYRQLEKDNPEEFSCTYFNYVMICKLTRDGRYDEAMAYTHKLTNATDRYKFQLDIIKVKGRQCQIVSGTGDVINR